MKKLDGGVWNYCSEERKTGGIIFHHYICNCGSQTNFVKLILDCGFEHSKNWVKVRVSESGNSKQIELSDSNPNSFIHYTSESRFQRDDFHIVKIIKK